MQEQAAATLAQVLKKHGGIPVLLLLSGGSSLELLSGIPGDVLGANITIGLLDERFEKSAQDTNWGALLKIGFLERAEQAGSKVLDVKIYNEDSLATYTDRFERELTEWRRRHPEGEVVVTEGVGADGHTAGIMPYPEDPAGFTELFEKSSDWVVGYDAVEKNKFPLRVTVTLPFLRNVVNAAVVYAHGEEKRAAIERVLAATGSLPKTPARIVREMRGARLFLDPDV